MQSASARTPCYLFHPDSVEGPNRRASFEAMTQELLWREEGCAGSTTGTNSNPRRDGSRVDAEAAYRAMDKESSPMERRRHYSMQGECAGVGKSDVRDIYDLLRHHDASGFFLVVSSHVRWVWLIISKSSDTKTDSGRTGGQVGT